MKIRVIIWKDLSVICQYEESSGPFKRRVSIKRRSQLSAGGMACPKTITAGSQLSTGGRCTDHIIDKFILILYLFQLYSCTREPIETIRWYFKLILCKISFRLIYYTFI